MTVEDDDALDLSEFNVKKHAGVLLHGIGDVAFLKRHREILQGRAKKSRGGRSTTMVYSYPFSLARRGVVATIDLSARNLHMLRTDHWLADPSNTVQVWLKGRAWDANEQTVNNIMVEGPPRAPLQEWSTSELAARCIGEDAEGLATRLVTNSVNGEDFAAMTYETFVNDLHFTPFAARKLDALRTKFMQA